MGCKERDKGLEVEIYFPGVYCLLGKAIFIIIKSYGGGKDEKAQ